MEKIDFISQLKPVLKSGKYTFKLQQQVKNKEGASPSFSSKEYSIEKNILVAGERFRLGAPQVHSRFPPPNNTGDHAGSLPQVVLNRATLPWERDATPLDETIPWMMVVVIYESELAAGKVQIKRSQKVSEYIQFADTPITGKIILPEEIGQDPNEQVDVLILDKSLTEKIIPESADLKLMTSVRQNKNSSVDISSEYATCFANRLPAIGEKSHAFLVSLEHRYKGDGSFDEDNGTEGQKVFFISLTDWSFSCPDETEFELTPKTRKKLKDKSLSGVKVKQNTDETVEEYLNETLVENTLYRGLDFFKNKLPLIFSEESILTKDDRQKILACLTVPTRTFEGILDKINKADFELNIPALTDNKDAGHYIKRGAVALPHHLRSGEHTASWYHGPLMTGKENKDIDEKLLPVRSSDTLYQYNENINMLDVSYASAWELGRLLMLNNPRTAKELFAWKQTNAAKLLQAEQQVGKDHLPFTDPGFEGEPLGKNLQRWFKNLGLLHNVPFNYLVPDEQLLPNESIRFFEVNNYWVECLLDGAFSIGRVTNTDYDQDKNPGENNIAPSPEPEKITGFLLRSEVVSGWPSLLVDGYIKLQDPDRINSSDLTEILRMERISPTILICLFNGKVETVDLHLKPESLHMGYDIPDEKHPDYYKKLRSLETGAGSDNEVEIEWKDKKNQIINMHGQSESIKTGLKWPEDLNAGQFALEMIVGVPRVRFNTV